jgi:hypothetical protein
METGTGTAGYGDEEHWHHRSPEVISTESLGEGGVFNRETAKNNPMAATITEAYMK